MINYSQDSTVCCNQKYWLSIFGLFVNFYHMIKTFLLFVLSGIGLDMLLSIFNIFKELKQLYSEIYYWFLIYEKRQKNHI